MHPETPPAGIRCTETREWVKSAGSDLLVGILPSAFAELGEAIAVELPELGRKVVAGESLAVVETAKTAFDVYAPTDGTVHEVNARLADRPHLLSLEPWTQWLVALRPAGAP